MRFHPRLLKHYQSALRWDNPPRARAEIWLFLGETLWPLVASLALLGFLWASFY
jgi:hypothetical protein